MNIVYTIVYLYSPIGSKSLESWCSEKYKIACGSAEQWTSDCENDDKTVVAAVTRAVKYDDDGDSNGNVDPVTIAAVTDATGAVDNDNDEKNNDDLPVCLPACLWHCFNCCGKWQPLPQIKKDYHYRCRHHHNL